MAVSALGDTAKDGAITRRHSLRHQAKPGCKITMEKRSHRRIRDLDVLAAFQGLVSNEIGCARISMMAREQTLPSIGRIQMRETNYLQIATSSLHRTAGPYRRRRRPPQQSWRTFLRNHAEAIAAIDLCVVPTVHFEHLFAFIIVGHGRRQLV